MKLLQVFSKTPSHKKFRYTPRFYNPEAEERQEREFRIKKELENSGNVPSSPQTEGEEVNSYSSRTRIAGSFRAAKKTATVQADPSANMLRLIILMVLVIGLIAFIQYGMIALYALIFFFFPFYFYLKFRKPQKKN